MMFRVIPPPNLVPTASRPLEPAEFLLASHAMQSHEKSTGLKSSVLVAALKGAKGVGGALLSHLPELAHDKIVDRLDAKSKTALAVTWVSRLSPASRLNVLNSAAKAYGFTSRPEGAGWQAHLEALALSKRSQPVACAETDVVLAKLLLGKLTSCQAVRQCSNHSEVVMRAVEQGGWALTHASAVLRDDRDVVMCAVGRFGSALEYASETLQGDRDVVMRAVGKDGWALMHASAPLRGDRDVVMRAVGKDGWALMHASTALRDDRDVVMRAIGKVGWALEYASTPLQGDRDVVMRAVGETGLALRYASAGLWGDRQVVMRAIEQNAEALRYASAALRNDPDLRRLAGQSW